MPFAWRILTSTVANSVDLQSALEYLGSTSASQSFTKSLFSPLIPTSPSTLTILKFDAVTFPVCRLKSLSSSSRKSFPCLLVSIAPTYSSTTSPSAKVWSRSSSPKDIENVLFGITYTKRLSVLSLPPSLRALLHHRQTSRLHRTMLAASAVLCRS